MGNSNWKEILYDLAAVAKTGNMCVSLLNLKASLADPSKWIANVGTRKIGLNRI